ncbi:hypothetical protein [Cupriavidus basilensis]|uniref:hypothetical protein n=1 Tax=Cupriavidus basilensis TaxID=68895 RepID=UPI0039F68492
MRKVFSREQVARILAAHMGGELAGWRVDGHSTQWDMVVETVEPGAALAVSADPIKADAQAAREKLREAIQAASETIARRREHAEAVFMPRGSFDVREVELGRVIGFRERVERLEAAVLLMASHDPTGPLQTIADFMSMDLGQHESAAMCHYPAKRTRGGL